MGLGLQSSLVNFLCKLLLLAAVLVNTACPGCQLNQTAPIYTVCAEMEWERFLLTFKVWNYTPLHSNPLLATLYWAVGC